MGRGRAANSNAAGRAVVADITESAAVDLEVARDTVVAKDDGPVKVLVFRTTKGSPGVLKLYSTRRCRRCLRCMRVRRHSSSD